MLGVVARGAGIPGKEILCALNVRYAIQKRERETYFPVFT